MNTDLFYSVLRATEKVQSPKVPGSQIDLKRRFHSLFKAGIVTVAFTSPKLKACAHTYMKWTHKLHHVLRGVNSVFSNQFRISSLLWTWITLDELYEAILHYFTFIFYIFESPSTSLAAMLFYCGGPKMFCGT